MWAIVILVVVASLYLAYEYTTHQRWLRAVPIRIHVNGTRGKSSVTRLIAAGLRASGLKVLAKTTGTLPMIIDEEGQDIAIPRSGQANIIEQRMFVREAARRRVEAIVVECMAINPELQFVEARQMIRPTIGVITNVRPDHLDVMGPTLKDVADSLANTIPEKSVLFTAETKMVHPLHARASALATEVKVIGSEQISEGMMAGFRYREHMENVAIALTVCQYLGINKQVALNGMYACNPDPGVLQVHSITHSGKHIRFINAFAANDPLSTLRIWKRMKEGEEWNGRHIAVINTRPDRVQRSQQFVELMLNGLDADLFVLIGGSANLVERAAVKRGLSKNRVVNLGQVGPGTAVERILNLTSERSSLFCMGNIGGIGLELANRLSKRADGGFDSAHHGLGAPH